MTPVGRLYGIGVGPGDPELITIKGLKQLQAVPVVAFPVGPSGKPGMAEGIIAQWMHPDQVQLPLGFAFVQDRGLLNQAWQQASDRVWDYLKLGQDVAFVSEGDISFYSTFTYLAQTLQQQHPEVQVQSIPGICSPLAAAAALGIPLTIGSQRLAVLPALYRVEELENALDWADVVVLMKVSSVYDRVWDLLQDRGLLDRTQIVERVTGSEQKIHRQLRDRRDLKLPYFSLAIIQVAPPSFPPESVCNF